MRVQQGQFDYPVFRAFWDTVFAAFQRLIVPFEADRAFFIHDFLVGINRLAGATKDTGRFRYATQ